MKKAYFVSDNDDYGVAVIAESQEPTITNNSLNSKKKEK